MSETVHYYLSLNLPFFPHLVKHLTNACLASSQVSGMIPHTGYTLIMNCNLPRIGTLLLSESLMLELLMVILANPSVFQELIAQSFEFKLLVETREQNLYTNEIICMNCYFSKTA